MIITYNGNAGTYTVDQQVSITCVASDSVSAVASSTCKDVQGPAYKFGLGTKTYSATATDLAGNTGSGSTSFTVTVTPQSLCNLVRQLVTNPKLADAMCAKILHTPGQGGDQDGRGGHGDDRDSRGGQGGKGGKGGDEQFNGSLPELLMQAGKSMNREQFDLLFRLSGNR